MNLSVEQRETLRQWLPIAIIVFGGWLLARGIRNLFWTLFGLAWVVMWSGGWFRLLF